MAEVSTIVFPTICSSLITKINAEEYPPFHGLDHNDLNDACENQDEIDILIAADCYLDLVTQVMWCQEKTVQQQGLESNCLSVKVH